MAGRVGGQEDCEGRASGRTGLVGGQEKQEGRTSRKDQEGRRSRRTEGAAGNKGGGQEESKAGSREGNRK